MTSAVKILADQALRVYHHIVSLFDRVKFDIKTKLYLFDTMVFPILLCAAKVWDAYNFKEVISYI